MTFPLDRDTVRRTLTDLVRRYGFLTQPLKMVRGKGGNFIALAEMESSEQVSLFFVCGRRQLVDIGRTDE